MCKQNVRYQNAIINNIYYIKLNTVNYGTETELGSYCYTLRMGISCLGCLWLWRAKSTEQNSMAEKRKDASSSRGNEGPSGRRAVRTAAAHWVHGRTHLRSASTRPGAEALGMARRG